MCFDHGYGSNFLRSMMFKAQKEHYENLYKTKEELKKREVKK